jgi:ZIP family zinc transporter
MLFLLFMTSLGAGTVFFFRVRPTCKFDIFCFGFASGVMLAASVWSLLIPAIEQSASYGALSFLPAALGFLAGGILLVFIDRITPCLRACVGLENGADTQYDKPLKLFLAVTVHNIPEGLAVGFAFGAASSCGESAALFTALALAFGIGVQNLPEGAAVTLPLYRASGRKGCAFLLGSLSGAVEPIFAILGYFLAATLSVAQPWLLALSAGAMVFTVVGDLIPDTASREHPYLGAWSVLFGFVLMMVLDVALSV